MVACLQELVESVKRNRLGPGHDGPCMVYLETGLCPLDGRKQYKDLKLESDMFRVCF